MSASRVFRGEFFRAKSAGSIGGRPTLIVTLDPGQARALDAALPDDLQDARTVPIAFVIGAVGEAAAGIQAAFDADDAPAFAPWPNAPETVAVVRCTHAAGITGLVPGRLYRVREIHTWDGGVFALRVEGIEPWLCPSRFKPTGAAGAVR